MQDIIDVLLKILLKYVEFQCNESHQSAFEVLKAKLLVAAIIRGHEWSLPFHIYIDASDMAIRGVLGQKEGQ